MSAIKPDILSIASVAKSKLFTIENIQLRFNNGQERNFERIRGKSHGSVMIVPLLDENTVLLIREYAVGVQNYVLAFPKGAVEADEDMFITANRELMEEVGYAARNLECIACLSASPGYMASMMHVIVAEDLYAQRLIGDEPELIEVVPWHLNNVDELLTHPEFHEARSIAALFMILRRRHAAI